MKTQEFLSVPAVPILKMLLLCYGSALFFRENSLSSLTPGHLEQKILYSYITLSIRDHICYAVASSI